MSTSRISIQAYINNIAFPKSLEELYVFYNRGLYNLEEIFNSEVVTWSVPKWTKIGDVVFFMHAKYAIQDIRILESELKSARQSISDEDFTNLWNWLQYGRELHKKYGGKIFAVGKVIKNAEYYSDFGDEFYQTQHWNNKIYADISDIQILTTPLDLCAFKEFIFISRQSAITNVLGNNYSRLISLISKENDLSSYYINASALTLNIANISKDNWLSITYEFRRSFFLEAQFRSYYVDYFLKELGDIKTIYKECRCRKNGTPDSFVDNVILFYKKYLPVEVKLSVSAEKDIIRQVSKYCQALRIFNDKIDLTPEVIYSNNCLVIDTDNLYMYDNASNNLSIIYKLNDIKVKGDINSVRELIIKSLN